ncbi:hypothetical protein Dsin_019485 [Dipteronia sinensis]|uniref:Phospholipase A2 n=1 Tax=Dipteronia sinensis TaxID=43782 RepID=A0AAE0E422_9ROSI|nr:hypothetical protein Dsin_019485 [Dipteronia sinensis]
MLMMNSGFLNMPWPWFNPKKDIGPTFNSMSVTMEQSKQKAHFDFKLLGWSLLSVVPWAINKGGDKLRAPTTINKKLKKHAQDRRSVEPNRGGNQVRFRPYVSKVPWHRGARAFLSQMFPRYGHYCGPNWSSGKDSGSPVWDMRPIDWLDYCCYCHDIGYDSHEQAELLKADFAFLECLERPHMNTRGNAYIAHIYKTMCITGLKNILIPYRSYLVKLRSRQPLIDFGWLSNVKWRINLQKT